MKKNINKSSVIKNMDIVIDTIKQYGGEDIDISTSQIYNECTVSKNNIEVEMFKSLLHLVKLYNVKIILKCKSLSDGLDVFGNMIIITSDYKIIVTNEYYSEYIKDKFSAFIDSFEVMTSDFYLRNY